MTYPLCHVPSANCWLGATTVMTPNHVHAHVEVLVRAGKPLIIDVTEPGVHGEAIAGTHGWGVSTPCAAAVAAATWGFDGLIHIPNVGMFAGLKSMMVHKGVVATAGPGVALMTDGLVPIEHCSWEPVVTLTGISVTPECSVDLIATSPLNYGPGAI